jgi:alanyl-tRNA synthetase
LVPSSPVIPFNDPTILFTNAGMNQFKDVFTGQRKVDYARATSSQKCIRAGGKHNDLDNVGFTARHHTFFEMLGNFSFGDYYKEEAIYFAWEWVTKYLELPPERLYATVYETDDQAFALWDKIAPELKNGRVLRFGKKDNFWSMGDIGPCGPCSEIHFDRGERFGTGPDDVINGEGERFIEIWNLVFMQDDQLPDGTVVPLPKPSVDTGAGLERIAAIKQNVDTNYGIDLFQNLIKAVSELTGSKYEKNVTSHHVIADHVRALTFALADGAGISNEGRGYVLRRILRRAARHGRLLGAREPFIYNLVPALVNEMGDTFPEIREKQQHVMNVIKAEEESFGRTLETGLELFEKVASRVKKTGGKVVEGEEVFRLYDTYGFPYDLTEVIASEQGLHLDRDGFESAMRRQQETSRAAAKFAASTTELAQLLDKEKFDIPATQFVRERLNTEASILKVYRGPEFDAPEDEVGIILDKTPFYLEAGGQISDTGKISAGNAVVDITDMYGHQDYYVHLGRLVDGSIDDLKPGTKASVETDSDRRWDIMRNHTATHLLHAALRTVLGEHVKQSGSYVGPDRLRFDFSHHQPMTAEDIRRVEEIVNRQILEAKPVETELMDIEKAKETGAMALFGEKYGDTVRVVSVPGFSKELCGGTHVNNISQIGPFFITLETGIASGVRRVEAITGREAMRFMLNAKQFQLQTASMVGRPVDEALAGVEQLRETNNALQKEIKRTKEAMFSGSGASVGDETKLGELSLWTNYFGGTDRDTIGAWLDSQKGADRPVVAIGIGDVNGKKTFMAAASNKAVKDFHIDVGKLAGEVLALFGGRGGGKASFAQGAAAGDTQPDELFAKVKAILKERV